MSILQKLLNLGLVDIGSEDSRFEKMQSASSGLVVKFKEDPGLLVPATLIALDEDMDENDPLFDLVEGIVAAEWKTLRNTHVNRPRELLRSIIIDAIAESLESGAETAAVVWNTAASPLRYRQVRLGKAVSVVEGLLRKASEMAEREAVVRAGFATIETKKRGKKKQPSLDAVQFSISANISDGDVLADVARAAGPQHPNVPSLETPNPHWSNQAGAWSHEFANRMATALSKAINLGNERIAAALGKVLTQSLGEFDKQLTEQFRDIEQLQTEMMQAHESSRMRLDVLWWAEALYSPLLEESYRGLDTSVAAVAAAIDLSNIVPPLSPASVAYVLDESLRRVSEPEAGSQLSIKAFLDGVADAGMKFGDHILSAPLVNFRLPLIALVGEAATGSKISPDSIRQRTGIDPSLTLSHGEIAMWIFRCIQANRLVEALR
ncbi:GTPase-associated system all-helical protein GASH [Burkholderia stagnalis]|uniref:GTPase-associated system all-helical protein GASH n=1 Tax=Burkholderia stagnalis TaxID=1503054 RepID=UPI000841AE87|nr:GTPase-associated system all-helical protein GASH [Burkholderia stagnalis]AOK51253.1 hypothetical protein WT74_00035 [Burkholderia stagnalis]